MAKGSGGHRLGWRGFRHPTLHLTEAVREAKVRVARSHPVGQRPPVDEAEQLQRPAQAARLGCERRNGTLAGKGRLRAVRSRCGQRPVGAAAWAKGKRGMKAALPWAELCRKPGGVGCGGQWPQPCAGEVYRSKSACAARRRATMEAQREAVFGQPAAILLARWAPVLK